MSEMLERMAKDAFEADWPNDKRGWDGLGPGHAQDRYRRIARVALLALREPMSELRDWMAIWDRVCDAADPDDAQDPPPWEEVRKVIGPDMDPTQFPSADYFDGYMRARLVDLVRDLLHALQTQEKGNA